MVGFAELLGRSCFSFLRGASKPEEMVLQAKALNLQALALCDRDGLYGLVRAHQQARECGLPLIVGSEIAVAPASSTVARLDDRELARWVAKPYSDAVPTLVLLAQNAGGYQNLCRLLTLAHAGLPKGEAIVELQHLQQHHEGLIAIIPVPGAGLTGRAALTTLSLPNRWRAQGGMENAIFDLETLSELGGVFEERLFLGAYRRLDGLDAARQRWLQQARQAVPRGVIASARPLFHCAQRKALADVMQCIRVSTTLSEATDRLQINAESRLRSGEEVSRLFRDTPHWLERTLEIARACQFNLSSLNYQFPCKVPEGSDADRQLQILTWQGAQRRYPRGVPSVVKEQLEKELRVIQQLQISPYFLSTLEIVEIARSKRILCQGRGSAANSAVCYVLGITAVDPERSSLLFERFVSAERHEPPDIDVDFEHERREEVIQEIYSRYGRDRAAMVSEVICYRGKSALREVGKVFGLSLDQVDRLCSSLTHWDDLENCEQRLRELNFELNGTLRQVLQLARLLQGFPRHLSIHVGGFVLSARPLYEVAPVEPARRQGRTVIPWDKDDIEALGFFKVDILGLGMLTAIRKALALIHEQGDLHRTAGAAEPFEPLDVVARIPAEDEKAYSLACAADTIGVFQIESRAQMAMLPRLRPQKFYDLVIEVAIVRPGPIQGGMVHPYLRRRNGEESSEPPHLSLDPILSRTLGVPLFQEQVMQIAIVGAGYSGGEADQLRRDMAAWKRTGRLLRHRERLLEGFSKNGISAEFAERLFEQIKGFGDYGFPESHAASFALLVYAALWLKAHYPAQFACALINSQPMGFYSPRVILRDAEKHGVSVKPLHINHSQWDCTLEQGAIRTGFRLLKGFSAGAAQRIVQARAAAVFGSIDEVVWRVGLARDQLQLLAEAGAFAELAPGRREALWQLRAPRVAGLFAGQPVHEPMIRLRKLSKLETLLLDYRRTGVSLDDHPLLHLRPQLDRHRVIRACDLVNKKTGDRVKVAGLVQSRQRPGTASGVVFITLEDETGVSNLVLYSRVFEENRRVAQGAMLLCAEGKVELQLTMPRADDRVRESIPVIHVIVEELQRLDLSQGAIPFRSRDFR